MVEIPPTQRAPIVREFPRAVPHGVQFFVRTGLVTSAEPESFAAAADHIAVFRLDNPTPA